MTYGEVLERYYEETGMTHQEYLELCKDFEEWMKESGKDCFFEQRNRRLLIAVRFEEGGVNLWFSQVTASYDWEDAELDARVEARALQVLEFLGQRPTASPPSVETISAALNMEPVYVIESMDTLREDGRIPLVQQSSGG